MNLRRKQLINYIGIDLWHLRKNENFSTDSSECKLKSSLPKIANKNDEIEVRVKKEIKKEPISTNTTSSLVENTKIEKPLKKEILIEKEALIKSKEFKTLQKNTEKKENIENAENTGEEKFKCCLFVFWCNEKSVCLIADIEEDNQHNEISLVKNMLNKSKMNITKYNCANFNWPISKFFDSKESAISALNGLMSSWKNRKNMIVMGVTSHSFFIENEYEIGAKNIINDVNIVSTFSPKDLIKTTSLRKDTWEHISIIRDTKE